MFISDSSLELTFLKFSFLLLLSVTPPDDYIHSLILMHCFFICLIDFFSECKIQPAVSAV